MGRKSQKKGRGGELELARLLQGYGYDVQPGKAVSFGSTPDLTGLPGIHIECKRAEQLRPYDWMAQAERDAVRFGDGLPTVFFRRNRQPWLVTMRLDDWIRLYLLKTTENDRKEGESTDTETAKGPCRFTDKSDERGSGPCGRN